MASMTKRIILYIENNLNKDLSLEKIAKELSYSKFYMARTFKNNTGITLYKYIQGRRLTVAAKKLTETKQPVIEIAFEAGYSSQQAFTKAFHYEYGCTPQKYREIGLFIPKQNKIRMKRFSNTYEKRRLGKFKNVNVMVLFKFTGGRIAA